MDNLVKYALDRINGIPLLKRLEELTRTSSNPSLSLSKVLLVKVRVLAECALRFTIQPYSTRTLKVALETLRKDRTANIALVFGNGPSLSKLNVEAVRADAKAGNLDIWCVNFFPLSSLSQSLGVPMNLVLSDPITRPDASNKKVQHLWETLRCDDSVKIFVPASWREIPELRFFKNRLTYFNDLSLEGWTKNIKPHRPRAYSSVTAYKSLALAIYAGYPTISVLGFDNSMYREVYVTANNELFQKSNHTAGASAVDEIGISHLYYRGISDYFYDASKSFLDLRLFFSNNRVTNLDQDSIVDAFPKVSTSPYIKKHKAR